MISGPLRRFRADKNVQGLSIAGAKRGRFKSYEFRNVVAVVTDKPRLSAMWLSSVPYWRRFARNYGTTNARFYSSDFGSDLFIGDLVLSRESSSCAQAGTPTLPSRMISFALSFLP